MAHARLSDEDVAKLLRQAEQSKHRAAAMQEAKERWPYDSDKPLIKEAIELELDDVELLTYNATLNIYKRKLFNITHLADNDDLVWIGPASPGEFVPCGVFNINRWQTNDTENN